MRAPGRHQSSLPWKLPRPDWQRAPGCVGAKGRDGRRRRYKNKVAQVAIMSMLNKRVGRAAKRSAAEEVRRRRLLLLVIMTQQQ